MYQADISYTGTTWSSSHLVRTSERTDTQPDQTPLKRTERKKSTLSVKLALLHWLHHTFR